MPERASLLVRTWNIAHGRDASPRRDGYRHVRRKLLEDMARVMVEDAPDVVLLQEVPVWAGGLLRAQTGMGVTLAPAYGAHIPFVHVPLPLAAGAAFGRALPDIARTQFEGQANALLYGEELLLVSARRVQLNERRRLRGEPRIAQLVRLRHRRAGRELAVANVHADPGQRHPQLEKAAYVLERFARGAPMVLGGDLNAGPRTRTVRRLLGRGWVEDTTDVGVDHLLVRGLVVEWPPTRWAPTRRDLALDGDARVRLSDHDPVDAVVTLDAA